MRKYRYNGGFVLLLAVTATAISLITALLIKLFPLVLTRILYVCQKFISDTFFQLSHPIQNIILAAIITAFFFGSLSFLIQIVKTKRLVNTLINRRVLKSARIEKMTTSLNLQDKVYVICNTNCFSFCAGILRPRILITTQLIETLTDRELESVFLHEKAHIKNHDPAKLLFGKTISCLFFFLPIFSEINKNMQATSEILADRFATSFQQDDKYLRSALRKILTTPYVNFALTPAIANSDFLEIRIKKLVNPTMKHGIYISWISIGTSIAFLFFMIFFLQTPVWALQTNDSKEQTYFVCSYQSACSQGCQQTSQTSHVLTPKLLFYPEDLEEKSFNLPSQSPKTQQLEYK